ncbi:1D-myo-inositol 2-acetamido-2-deoxy-alpha-D-glucopyranoside deacetylase [Desulfosporosinus acididurans]|uniref:1D-myo-inositol 2-acetamido-2-deoxy-alpha-D-glucopyranoside deacetylase n=1 Tax=Desulfosporosinus acididurans TaxID=476652 RepID=A0A0J1FV44_9FIRM|nr:bacillithiol biosynthesis deacetylase BshB2 [Desulfosporosinus acididurans]KLU67309.1 1D-myo-inositol 2-acetamido-2-deoxy-alpha-D-glucopyranoside deacetylase [Desulfosporosinus acididurans]
MGQHILVVFPHPDDETFGCGGTLALFAKSGIPITYICGTLGQMGRNMGNPFFANRETLSKIREAELEKACKAIGIQHLIKLGLRDKTIEFEDPEPIVNRIEQILREVQPSLVLTHYPGYAVHPDHNALGELTIKAVSRLSTQDRPTIYAHAFARNCQDVIGPPDIVNDISAVADVKCAAILAHRSQSQVMFPRDNKTEVNEPTKNAYSHMLQRESFWTYRCF